MSAVARLCPYGSKCMGRSLVTSICGSTRLSVPTLISSPRALRLRLNGGCLQSKARVKMSLVSRLDSLSISDSPVAAVVDVPKEVMDTSKESVVWPTEENQLREGFPWHHYSPEPNQFCMCTDDPKSRQVEGTLPPPWLSVAPMMDWTNPHYRYLARLITRYTWLYTEMIVDNTLVHQKENLDRFLEYPTCQRPLVLQIGGSEVEKLADAAQLAVPYGYTEINLNCGCPSQRVAGNGCFGARLMLDPKLVGDAMAAIAESCESPVTVKCRIGVDDYDSYEGLCEFVSTVSSRSPVRHFIIHSRKALLKGLTPEQNLKVPPLRYEYYFALLRDFPHLKFTINGGFTGCHQAAEALKRGAHGVMIGRAAYQTPWASLGDADRVIYGMPNRGVSRRQILQEYMQYADVVQARQPPARPTTRALTQPLLGLFHSEPAGGRWRHALDKELMSPQTLREVLEKTMHVLPDEVLDALPGPPQAGSRQIQLPDIAPLPPTPDFLLQRPPLPLKYLVPEGDFSSEGETKEVLHSR